MKKLIALILVLVLCLSLCACGNAKMSKEEMEKNVEVTTSVENIQKDSQSNLASAKLKYCNKTIVLSGIVSSIHEDYVELAAKSGCIYVVDVSLSLDDLVQIKQGQFITVIGTTTDKIITKSENIAGHTFDIKHYQMPYAYFVTVWP